MNKHWTPQGTITSCQKTGVWQWALTLLDAMDARAVAPNGMSFNGSIGACETGPPSWTKEWKELTDFLEKS